VVVVCVCVLIFDSLSVSGILDMYVWRQTWYLWRRKTADLDLYEQIKTNILGLTPSHFKCVPSPSLKSKLVPLMSAWFHGIMSWLCMGIWSLQIGHRKRLMHKIASWSAFEAASNGKIDATMAPNSSPMLLCQKIAACWDETNQANRQGCQGQNRCTLQDYLLTK